MDSPSTAADALQDLKAEAGCTRCSLYLHATHVVPGEGPADALVMFAGEQPGDVEDRRGLSAPRRWSGLNVSSR
jgi:uracil-DNA glycosylase